MYDIVPRHTVVRTEGVARYTSGTIEAWGGIASASVADWAEHFDCTPEDVLQTIEQAGVEPLVDTAKQKGQDRERPTDPALRCLALTTTDTQTLKTILDR